MLGRHSADAWHVIWYTPRPAGNLLKGVPLDHHFRGMVAVALFRSAWDDPNALFVGVKAGYNRVNHGHLDLGNFELDALGVRWARDLGSDNYNIPGYWDGSRNSGRRWRLYRLNSQSHNICTIDGKDQNVSGRAKFTAVRMEKDAARAVLDLTGAYTPTATKALRGVAMLPGRRAVLVQDEFRLAKPAEVTWAMTTDAATASDGRQATLSLKGRRLRATILSPAGAAFTSASAEQKPPQRRNKGVRRLLVRVKSGSGAVRIAVLLAPIRSQPGGNQIPPLKPLSQW